MREQLFYAGLGLLLIIGLAGALYMQFKNDPEEKTFVSFNDGSVECMTIIINKSSTKEQLAQALAAGRAAMLGEIGNTPGCVNYEIVR